MVSVAVTSARARAHPREWEREIGRGMQPDGAGIIRVHMEQGDADPFDELEAMLQGAGPGMALHDPQGDLSFVARGALAHSAWLGADRFQESGAYCSEICEQIREVQLGPGEERMPRSPWMVGGFAFAVQGARRSSSPWRGWGDGSLWVPEVVTSRSGGRSVSTLTRMTSPTDDPAELAAWSAWWRQRIERDRLRSRWAGSPWRPGPAAEASAAWRQGVDGAVSSLEDGSADLHKVVLARSSRIEAGAGQVFSVAATARALRAANPGCTTFALVHPDGSAFVGCTPELLVAVAGRSVETVALAGTARRASTEDDDRRRIQALMASEKDAREHRWVVDAIGRRLGEVCDQVDVAATPRVRTLAHLHHLETPVKARLRRGRSLWDVLARLHPTPAVGGHPRGRALSWITEHEGIDRGWYAGPIGWIDGAGDGAFHVALRSALLREGTAWAYAGAGLVAGSDAQGEWRETEAKLISIRQSLRTQDPSTAVPETP